MKFPRIKLFTYVVGDPGALATENHSYWEVSWPMVLLQVCKIDQPFTHFYDCWSYGCAYAATSTSCACLSNPEMQDIFVGRR